MLRSLLLALVLVLHVPLWAGDHCRDEIVEIAWICVFRDVARIRGFTEAMDGDFPSAGLAES